MDLDSKEVERCPKCEWLSTTKIVDENSYVGLTFQPTGSYFVCVNPKCNVDRIYGENAILLKGGK